MGEMADYLLEDCYLASNLNQDYYDDSTGCKYCGKQGLYWYETDGKWRLHSMNVFGKLKLHTCKKYRKES